MEKSCYVVFLCNILCCIPDNNNDKMNKGEKALNRLLKKQKETKVF